MPSYKDTNGKLHFLDSADYKHLLPSGCVEITAAEVASIKAAELKANAPSIRRAEIKALESTQGRALREAAIGIPGALGRLQTIDAQITALRVQII